MCVRKIVFKKIYSFFSLQNFRKDPLLFRQFQRIHTHVIRFGILCEPCCEKVVGAIQALALARQSGPLHQRRHSWKCK